MDDAHRAVAVLDAVEVLGAADDLRLDPRGLELRAQVPGRLLHVVLPVGAALRDPLLDLLVLARVQRGEGEVFQLPFEVVDTEAVRERRVHLQRLLGLLDLLLLAEIAERVHVVQAVAELDEDDPDVGGHRDDHLAVVLGLLLLSGGEVHLGELGDAVDEHGDLAAKLLLDPAERRACVLDDVVEERRGDGDGVELELRGVQGRADRVVDVRLPALSALPAVQERRRHEGPGDELVVDVCVVALDGREEVVEQRPVLGRDLRQSRVVRQVGRKSGV